MPVSVMQEIMNVEQIMDDNVGLELTNENVETVLDEIRPYLVGMPQPRSDVQNVSGAATGMLGPACCTA